MKKKVFLALAIFLAAVPAFAVLSEKDLSQTLSVLHHELKSAFKASERSAKRMRGSGERQHTRMVKMMQMSNELSLMLYSQKQDYTFDMTYALNEVSEQYKEFSARRMPFDDIVSRLDIEIDRYDRLIHTLRSLPPSTTVEYIDSTGNVVRIGGGPGSHHGHHHHEGSPEDEGHPSDSARALPERPSPPVPDGATQAERDLGNFGGQGFVLDSLGQADRDSCLFYAERLLLISSMQKEALVRDSTHYTETAAMLESAYNYAQKRYKTVQNKIFIEGQTNYVKLLRSFPMYWSRAVSDANEKYSRKELENVHSQWRGPMVIGFSLFTLFYIVVSLVLGWLLVMLLTARVKFFQKEKFRKHRFEMGLIFSVIIFALTIMIAGWTSSQNFFSMASKLLVEFAWMLAAILVSLVIRLEGDAVKKGIWLYFPILLLCFIIISLRIAFIPNRLLNIVFPPLLLLFTVFQGFTLKRYRKSVPNSYMVFGWVSLAIMVITTVIAILGYVLLGVEVLIWWIFELTLLQTVNAVYDLIDIYYKGHIRNMKLRYKELHPEFPYRNEDDFVAVTWPYSLVKKALAPIAIILSLPLSLYLASSVFDLNGIFSEYAAYPFVNVEGYIHLSFSKIVLVVSLYFLFAFLVYLGKTLYRHYKIRSIVKNSGGKAFQENQVNFTLAENIIAISLWALYLIMLFTILKIPTAAVKVIGAGLATGLGFAMKDILNNFFYGVQLMSGRLRVGDYIECDGVRGRVDSINYQTTQIVSADGAVMAFPNSTLFAKNFKNLTKNHSYEMLAIEVGVKYGSDVEQVRSIIVEALKPLQVRDKYGREVVDPKFGIQVRFMGFGDNSVNLSVYQFTTVEEHYTYAAKAKELIYNALNENGIEIPFPQRDLYIKTLPEK